LGLSLYQLNEITSFYLGQTVYELLQNRIHKEAKYLLQYTHHSVKEITYILGCSDLACFCRCFKQRIGKTPKEQKMNVKSSQSVYCRSLVVDHLAACFSASIQVPLEG